MKSRGGAAIVGAEVCVARGKREAVRFANDGARQSFGLEIQIGCHLLNDAGLLRVFAAEKCEAGLDDFEKLQHYSSDALKMAGARTSLEARAYTFTLQPSCENP